MKTTTFLEEFQAVEAALRDRIDSATLEYINIAISNGDAITKHAFAIALNRHFGNCVEQSQWVDLSKLTTMGVQYPTPKTPIPEEAPNPKQTESEAKRLTDIYEILRNKPCPIGFDNGAYNGTIRHIGMSILRGRYDIAWQCVLYIANLFYGEEYEHGCLEIAREANGHVKTGICLCENSSVVLVRCGFKDGLKHGAQVTYFDDGSFRVQHICNFKNNSPIGVSILYDNVGNILNLNTKHINVPF